MSFIPVMAKLKFWVIAAENSVSYDPSEILFICWFGAKASLNYHYQCWKHLCCLIFECGNQHVFSGFLMNTEFIWNRTLCIYFELNSMWITLPYTQIWITTVLPVCYLISISGNFTAFSIQFWMTHKPAPGDMTVRIWGVKLLVLRSVGEQSMLQ